MFDEQDETMLPRFMIRNLKNIGHVYCAIVQNSTHKVVRVELNPEQPGQVQTKEVFVLMTGMIVGLESDPEDFNNFYLIDDFQNVFQIYENKEGKGVVHSRISLVMHSL